MPLIRQEHMKLANFRVPAEKSRLSSSLTVEIDRLARHSTEIVPPAMKIIRGYRISGTQATLPSSAAVGLLQLVVVGHVNIA